MYVPGNQGTGAKPLNLDLIAHVGDQFTGNSLFDYVIFSEQARLRS